MTICVNRQEMAVIGINSTIHHILYNLFSDLKENLQLSGTENGVVEADIYRIFSESNDQYFL